MSHRRCPGWSVISGGCTVNFHAFGVHGLPQKRHIVLPADDRSYPACRSVHRVQSRSVSETPYHAFWTCGRELAMGTGDTSFGIEQEGRAIEGVAEEFNDADDGEDLAFSGHFAQARDLGPVELDGSLGVALVFVSSALCAQADWRTED